MKNQGFDVIGRNNKYNRIERKYFYLFVVRVLTLVLLIMLMMNKIIKAFNLRSKGKIAI
ncbi:hypothetical protein [Geminocystis herdmanii]|uniref:hypothetical protein n=1 Tax=Geminocystis herdmanii TaxID=669359 RepID=UPI00034B01AB|nr:hypothetical protein [Geminocystis herdmanii]